MSYYTAELEKLLPENVEFIVEDEYNARVKPLLTSDTDKKASRVNTFRYDTDDIEAAFRHGWASHIHYNINPKAKKVTTNIFKKYYKSSFLHSIIITLILTIFSLSVLSISRLIGHIDSNIILQGLFALWAIGGISGLVEGYFRTKDLKKIATIGKHSAELQVRNMTCAVERRKAFKQKKFKIFSYIRPKKELHNLCQTELFTNLG